MSETSSLAELPGCSIAIKCADDPLIERCLDSIDDPAVSINAVITPSRRIERILDDREIPYSIMEYGNIAKSADTSVREAEHNNVIVMDSDAFFSKGAISKLREALQTAVIAKPRVVFAHDGTRLSKIVADSRQSFYDRPEFVTNPGLALNRSKITELCGYVFNPLIRWTEDAELNFRMDQSGVSLEYVPDAVIQHDPVEFSHEMRCAFLYGIGKRLSVEHTPGREPEEDLPMIIKNLKKSFSFEGSENDANEMGYDAALVGALWRTLYYAGYHAQKLTGRWSVQT